MNTFYFVDSNLTRKKVVWPILPNRPNFTKICEEAHLMQFYPIWVYQLFVYTGINMFKLQWKIIHTHFRSFCYFYKIILLSFFFIFLVFRIMVLIKTSIKKHRPSSKHILLVANHWIHCSKNFFMRKYSSLSIKHA